MNECKGRQACPEARSYLGTAKQKSVWRQTEKKEPLSYRYLSKVETRKGYLKYTWVGVYWMYWRGEMSSLEWKINILMYLVGRRLKKIFPLRKQKTHLLRVETKLHSHLLLTPAATLLPQGEVMLESPGMSCSSPWHSGDQTQLQLMDTSPTTPRVGS